MKKPVFTGAGVAIITPFKSTGEVNYEEFGRIIDHQIAHHTDAIIVCGTTGEASALHGKEHREVLPCTIRSIAKPLPGAVSMSITVYRSLPARVPTTPHTPLS